VEITWDPQHPFRLASGEDDGTVRLWDVRKAGSAACLGVLDRENGPGSDVTRNDNNVNVFKNVASTGNNIIT
jgi:WD40 repeat protein